MDAREQGDINLTAEFEKDLPDIITLQDDLQGPDLTVLLSVPDMDHTLLVYQQPDLDNMTLNTPVTTGHSSGQPDVIRQQFYFPSHVTPSPLVTSKVTNTTMTPVQQDNNSSATTNTSSETVSPEKTGKSYHQKSKHRKRRVVVSPRNKHRKLAGANDTARRSKKPSRSSSSSFALTSSPTSSDTSTPPRTKKGKAHFAKGAQQNNIQESPHAFGSNNTITISRFQCRVCGQTRFLALVSYVGLPLRMCECGSAAVSVPSWVRVARGPHGGLTGGGLGRECVRCSRCLRLYCSEAFLRRHHCTRQRRASKVVPAMENDAPQEWPGVCEVPTCSLCGEAFIFEPLLQRHMKRDHVNSSK